MIICECPACGTNGEHASLGILGHRSSYRCRCCGTTWSMAYDPHQEDIFLDDVEIPVEYEEDGSWIA